MELNKAGLDLILRFEVGGGEEYYNRYLRRPTWPEYKSGVTIGIGYDLGYNSKDAIADDWDSHLDAADILRLQGCAGITGQAAQAAAASVKDILVPWEAALAVFKQKTITRFWESTLRIYPGADKLTPNCQAALLSLVFNRGTSLKGDSRKEMAAIKGLVAKQDYRGIAEQLRAMKRIWVGTKIETGMARRRDAEAKLAES